MVTKRRLQPDGPEQGETFHELLAHPHARIEHIVSSASPDDREYDQDDDEFVLLLTGSSTLEVDGERVELTAGDHLFLPAHTPHRVLRTAPGTEWLAVHLTAEPARPV